jgi:hypothetical protein
MPTVVSTSGMYRAGLARFLGRAPQRAAPVPVPARTTPRPATTSKPRAVSFAHLSPPLDPVPMPTRTAPTTPPRPTSAQLAALVIEAGRKARTPPGAPDLPTNPTARAVVLAARKARSPLGTDAPALTGVAALVIAAGKKRRGEI